MGTIKQNRANNIVTGGKIDATDGLNNNVPAANIANASLTNVTAYPPSAGAGVSQLASIHLVLLKDKCGITQLQIH